MSSQDIRIEFPQLVSKVHGKSLVYLDNAATSLRPSSVIEKWKYMSSSCNSNLHRAVHKTAVEATEEYESSREAVQKFLNARHTSEIIFTSGATASLNLVAYSFGDRFVNEGDEIIVTEEEHHSNLVPWQLLCRRKRAVLRHISVDESGRLEYNQLKDLINSRTKLVCITQVSNVLGLINPVGKIAEICHSNGCMLLVDGSQGVVHETVDVQEVDCDFYVFSGHKMYAAPGTGVLYGKRKILDEMPPFLSGGEMIDTVSWDNTSFAPLPHKFEAGTQNISAVPTFKPAIEMLCRMRSIDIDEVTGYMIDALRSDSRIRLYGLPDSEFRKVPLFSFTVQGVHHEDLALILDKMGIAVRSGQMCAEPLMERYSVTGMLRASFAPYNTLEEAEYFIKCLDMAIRMLK